MKKSVIIIIFIIYIASIVFINFFGLKIASFDVYIYATKVECINSDMKLSKDGTYKYVGLFYTKDLKYTIEHKVYPENVTNNKVEYIYDTTSTISIDQNTGIVSFGTPRDDREDFTIKIRTLDGTNIETTIRITVVNM